MTMHADIHAQICACMCSPAEVNDLLINITLLARICDYVYPGMPAHVHTHRHAYVHICMCICMYTMVICSHVFTVSTCITIVYIPVYTGASVHRHLSTLSPHPKTEVLTAASAKELSEEMKRCSGLMPDLVQHLPS